MRNGKGWSVEKTVDGMRMVAEGVKPVPLSLNLAGEVAAEMPISAMLVALARGPVSGV